MVLAVSHGGFLVGSLHLYLFDVVHDLSTGHKGFLAENCVSVLLAAVLLCLRADLWHVGIFGGV